MIICACGCGEIHSGLDPRGRPKRFIHRGHNLRKQHNYMNRDGAFESRSLRKPHQLILLNPFFGKKHSDKSKQRMSEYAKLPRPHLRGSGNGMFGRVGRLNPNFRDGSSPERQRLYSGAAWRKLRREVCQRDKYVCVKCGGGRPLHLHHVKSWAGNPDIRFDASNVVTLCAECHRAEHRKQVIKVR